MSGALTPPPALPYATSDDFFPRIQALFPRGAAWTTDSDAELVAFQHALADCFASVHAVLALLSEVESDPNQTTLLLPDFERALGLPDPCTPAGATLQQRRAALLSKMAQIGGQSKAYFIAVAAALGFTITITEFRPFRASASAAGDNANSQDWLFAWQVNAPAQTVSYFRAGQSAAGEPLAAWGNATLECVIRRLAPAHTTVIFAYGS